MWMNPWISNSSIFKPRYYKSQIDIELKISDLIDHNDHTWKIQELQKWFSGKHIKAILSISISSNKYRDRII